MFTESDEQTGKCGEPAPLSVVAARRHSPQIQRQSVRRRTKYSFSLLSIAGVETPQVSFSSGRRFITAPARHAAVLSALPKVHLLSRVSALGPSSSLLPSPSLLEEVKRQIQALQQSSQHSQSTQRLLDDIVMDRRTNIVESLQTITDDRALLHKSYTLTVPTSLFDDKEEVLEALSPAAKNGKRANGSFLTLWASVVAVTV